jgi:hypothetical protein
MHLDTLERNRFIEGFLEAERSSIKKLTFNELWAHSTMPISEQNGSGVQNSAIFSALI